MKTLFATFLFVATMFGQLQAQNIEEWIDSKKPLLFEKLYVHVDRELYAPGDIIWMKAYQVNGITHQLNSNFRNIFIQLVAENGRIVKDLMLFSIQGQANGEFKTDTLPDGIYTIRAFTRYLKNYGEEAFFHKRIRISKSLGSLDLTGKSISDDSKIDVAVLPEGGSLVLNAVNTVAFKAIDKKGRGVYVTGRILDDLGDTIVSFSTSYLGMGKFLLMPVDNRTYYAAIDRYPEMKIPLPKAIENGICLNYKMDEKSLVFEISTNMNHGNYPEFYFVATHKGGSLFYKAIEMSDFVQAISIDKNLFPEGISKITLLDMALNPIAERLIFMDHGKGDLLNVGLNQQAYKPREKVEMVVDALLEPGDSVASTMSVSVVNKNYFSTGENTQNIKSYLLLDSELKGAIESPASYFVDDQFHTSAEKLDLLMLVHGWRTYLWDDIEKKPIASLDDWNDAGIDISGTVKKLLWNAPLADASVFLDYAFRSFRIGETTSNSNGRFLFRHIYFADNLRVMINARTKNGTSNAEIILDPLPKKDSIISTGSLNKACFDIDLNLDFMRDSYNKLSKELEYDPETGGILLQSIDIVQDKKKSIIRSGGAYAWADKTLTITRNDYSFLTVLDYLRSKVTTLTDYGDVVMIKNKPVTFMVDGLDSQYSFNEIRTIKMNEIETIDILNPGFRKGYSMGTLGTVDESGLIAIYRKPNPDIMESDQYVKGRIMPGLKGFPQPKMFYSPEYTLENIGSSKPDHRPTLLWEPDVEFVDGKASVGFYTSDVPGEYVVSLEAITKNGKICFGTASFKVDKK